VLLVEHLDLCFTWFYLEAKQFTKLRTGGEFGTSGKGRSPLRAAPSRRCPRGRCRSRRGPPLQAGCRPQLARRRVYDPCTDCCWPASPCALVSAGRPLPRRWHPLQPACRTAALAAVAAGAGTPQRQAQVRLAACRGAVAAPRTGRRAQPDRSPVSGRATAASARSAAGLRSTEHTRRLLVKGSRCSTVRDGQQPSRWKRAHQRRPLLQ